MIIFKVLGSHYLLTKQKQGVFTLKWEHYIVILTMKHID